MSHTRPGQFYTTPCATLDQVSTILLHVLNHTRPEQFYTTPCPTLDEFSSILLHVLNHTRQVSSILLLVPH